MVKVEFATYRGQPRERFPELVGCEVLVEKTGVTDMKTKTHIYHCYYYKGNRVVIPGYYLSDFREGEAGE